MTYSDGGVYTGGWRKDKREGMGRYEKDGTIYEGGWLNDERIEHKEENKNLTDN